MEEGRGNISNIIIAILAMIIVILVIAFVRSNQNRPVTLEAPEQGTSNAPTDTASPDPEPTPDARAFNFIAKNDWALYERAEEAVQEIAEGQIITDGVILDPAKENTAYFATYARDNSLEKNLVSIYAYNTDDFSFERVFRATYGEGDFSGIDESIVPIMRAVGYENGKLILHVYDEDDEPDACTHPILAEPMDADDEELNPRERVVAMNLADPYGGFTAYEPSDEAIENAEDAVETCEE